MVMVLLEVGERRLNKNREEQSRAQTTVCQLQQARLAALNQCRIHRCRQQRKSLVTCLPTSHSVGGVSTVLQEGDRMRNTDDNDLSDPFLFLAATTVSLGTPAVSS